VDPKNLVIAVPPPIDGTVPPTDPGTKEPSDGGIGAPDEDSFRLSWPTKTFLVSAGNVQTIALRGTNTRKKSVSFKEIRIIFKAKKAAKTLFFEDEFRLWDQASSTTSDVNTDADTDTPAPPPYTGGIVKLSRSDEATVQVKLNLVKLLPKKTEDTWQATIDTESGGDFSIPPDAWIEVAITGIITAAGNWANAISIDEDWADSSMHWKEDIKVGAQ